jgi:hypothetical protein
MMFPENIWIKSSERAAFYVAANVLIPVWWFTKSMRRFCIARAYHPYRRRGLL